MWHRNQNRDRSTHTQTHNKPELQQTLHPATQTGSKRESEAGWQGRGLNLCLVLLMSRITHRQAGAGTAARGGTHTHTHTLRLLSGRRKVWQLLHTHTHIHSSLSLEHDSGKLAKIYATGKGIPRKCRQFLDPGQEQEQQQRSLWLAAAFA